LLSYASNWKECGDILFISFVIASGEAIIFYFEYEFCSRFAMAHYTNCTALFLSIFLSILIAKKLLTGSLKNRIIDNLETQKKSISMKNSQFFDYLLSGKSK
jgi:hypothetical protein